MFKSCDVPNQIPLLIQFVLIVVSLFYIAFKPLKKSSVVHGKTTYYVVGCFY